MWLVLLTLPSLKKRLIKGLLFDSAPFVFAQCLVNDQLYWVFEIIDLSQETLRYAEFCEICALQNLVKVWQLGRLGSTLSPISNRVPKPLKIFTLPSCCQVRQRLLDA